jgi:hypothetical protein
MYSVGSPELVHWRNRARRASVSKGVINVVIGLCVNVLDFVLVQRKNREASDKVNARGEDRKAGSHNGLTLVVK